MLVYFGLYIMLIVTMVDYVMPPTVYLCEHGLYGYDCVWCTKEKQKKGVSDGKAKDRNR